MADMGTIYGLCERNTDWRWAEEKNLAVIMPSGDNQFYIDKEDTEEYYGEYVGKELVEFTRKMFPLSEKKEDTFIAGLSMGGYGALINGLSMRIHLVI